MAETMVASSVKSDHSSRKNKKPLMEKRRRARINSCLAQLKSLVLQAIKKDSSQFSKLEKADILELTVKHLRALQRQQAAGVLTSAHPQDTAVVGKYRAGFNECAKEVVRYMGSVREVNEEVKERVVGHLASCLQVVNQITPMESLQHQHQMKPLHVHIPPPPPSSSSQHHHHHHLQQLQFQQQQQQQQQALHAAAATTTTGCVTSVVAVPPSSSVIMHTAAVSPQPPPSSSSSSPLAAGYNPHPHTPSGPLLRPSATSSPQEGHTPASSPSPSSSVVSVTPTTPTTTTTPFLSALPLLPSAAAAAAAMTTGATTTTVVSPASSLPAGAFKLVPGGAGGAVAVYVGTANPLVPHRAPPPSLDAVSVDALPLYSVAAVPTNHHHHHHPAVATPLTAFVSSSSSSRLSGSDYRYEDLSPVKAEEEYSPLNAAAAAAAASSLPVDLRQVTRGKKALEECPSAYPYPPASALSTGHCSPAMADEKLWRPW